MDVLLIVANVKLKQLVKNVLVVFIYKQIKVLVLVVLMLVKVVWCVLDQILAPFFRILLFPILGINR